MPVINNRDELIRLRTTKVPATERRDAGEIPPEVPVVPQENAVTKVTELVDGAGAAATNLLPPPSPPAALAVVPLAESAEVVPGESDSKDGQSPIEEATKDESTPAEEPVAADSLSTGRKSSTEGSTASGDSAGTDTESNNPTPTEPKAEVESEENTSKEGSTSGPEKDYDSDEAVGKEDAAKIDQDLEDEEDDISDVQINPYGGAVGVKAGETSSEADASNPANKVTEMFHRLLNMNEKESGQMVVQVAGDGAYTSVFFQLSIPILCVSIVLLTMCT